MATQTEREPALPHDRDDQDPDVSETDDESVPYDGGLVRLETPGSESSD
jgi:hypothetical protein